MRNRKVNWLGYVAALGLLGGCSTSPDSTGANTTAVSPKSASNAMLKGAGSTFIDPIMSQWVQDYRNDGGASINYQANGSGGGIKALIDKTVDFAGSDAPMNADEINNAKAPVIHLPAVIGTVCVAYNVPGVETGLHLTGPVIADIFLTKIKKWNDPQIKSLNPNVNLPDADITVVHRSEGSGTTYLFTDYLSKVSPDWKSAVGEGKSVKWPESTLGAKGSTGVAGLMKNHANSIGYVELTYATQTSIPFAAVQNAKGKFITPSPESGSAAAASITIPDNMQASLTNTDGADAYPITGFTYLIVYESAAQGEELKNFLKWVLDKGQASTNAKGYAPIPEVVKTKEKALIDSIKQS